MKIEKYTEKLNVGDIVKIKDNLNIGQQYKMFTSERKRIVNSSMKNVEGKIVKITCIYDSECYGIDADFYNWTDEMFEGKVHLESVEEKFNQFLKPYLLPGTIVTFIDGNEYIVFKEHLVTPYRTMSINIDLYNKVKKVTFNNRTLYENKEFIDWTNVKVDTPVYVREFENSKWKRRHFAKYENGNVYCFNDGTTSFTNEGDSLIIWKYAKLRDDVNE